MPDNWKAKLRRMLQTMKVRMETAKGQGQSRESNGAHPFEAVDLKAAPDKDRGADAARRIHGTTPVAPHLPPEPDRGEGSAFNIGIDVGTSTTKVCARPPGANVSVHVIPLGSEKTAMCPSTVAVEGGRLYFGSEAESRAHKSGAQAFRQLKVCIACEVGLRPEVPNSWCRCQRRREDGACSALFTVAGVGNPTRASDLLTFLLAWAMGESRRKLPDDLTGGLLPRVTYSISAPVDQLDAGSELNAAYAQLVYHSWRLSGVVQQGVRLNEALSWIASIEGVPLPPQQERAAELCSESGAIGAGFAMSPEIEEGLYAVIDIGAWTSEMAFFRFTEVGSRMTGRPAIAFYAARSHRVAANQVDERCRNHLLQLYNYSAPHDGMPVERIREQREANAFGRRALQVYTDRPEEVRPRQSALLFAQDLVAEELRRRFVETLGEAFDRERLESRWQNQLRVLFAGGGSQDPVLPSGIEHSFIVERKTVPAPSDLVGLPSQAGYIRFLVAYGLAQGIARWPRVFHPSQVPQYRRERRTLPTSEELGYDEP